MSSRWNRILGSVALFVSLASATAGCQSCAGETRDESAPTLKPEEKGRLRGLQRLKVARPEFVGDGASMVPPVDSAAPLPSASAPVPAPSASAH